MSREYDEFIKPILRKTAEEKHYYKLKIAKKMLQLNKPVEDIIEITGFTLDEIEHFRRNEMSEKDEVWYIMLDTLKGQESIFWKGEIYDQEDFQCEGLDLEDLVKQGKCKLFDKVENAINQFVKKRITFQRAAEIAGYPLNDFINLLNSKGIPWMEYTEEEFEQDIKTIKHIEAQELSHIFDEKLASRLDLPEDQWIHLPEGVRIFDYYYMSEEEKERVRKLGYKQYKENVKKFQEEKKKESKND